MNCVVDDITDIEEFDTVSFQVFQPNSDYFLDDSEEITFNTRVFKAFDSDGTELGFAPNTIRLPYDFDSEQFLWVDSEFTVDSEQGLITTFEKWNRERKFHTDSESFADSDQMQLIFNHSFLNKLDMSHLGQLDFYNNNDSEYYQKWSRSKTLNYGETADVGEWVDTTS